MAEDNNEGMSNTPLDLLINAIAGNHYPIQDESHDPHEEVNLDQFLAQRRVEENQQAASKKRPRSEDPPSPRQRKIAKTLTSHTALSSVHLDTSYNAGPSSVTTVEVWHPTTGQKSYGKERRILNPPPILRMSGGLSSDIVQVTMSTLAFPNRNGPSITSGSQTHRIGTPFIPPLTLAPELESKRQEKREERRKVREAALNAGFGVTLPIARSAVDVKNPTLLRDGLTFPGLWIGDEAGKSKDFRLELKCIRGERESHRSQEDIHPSIELHQSYGNESSTHEGETVDALADMLAPSSMEVLQPLHDTAQIGQNNDLMSGHEQEIHESFFESVQATSVQLQNPTHPVEETPLGGFISDPVRIVSKPSIKTAKARSMASCFSPTSAFSLWTRIHGQTVRTKWMNLESNFNGHGPRLTSKTGKWSPFRFEVLHRAAPPIIEKSSRSKYTETPRDESKLTYGSVVVLVDLQTGIKSDPVKIVKVEQAKSMVGMDDGQPISELQRIGLIRMRGSAEDTTGGSRWYLSAPGARVGGGEVSSETMTRARGQVKGMKQRGGRTAKGKEKEPAASSEQALAASFLQRPQTLGAAETAAALSSEAQPAEDQSVRSIEAALRQAEQDAGALVSDDHILDPSLSGEMARQQASDSPRIDNPQSIATRKKTKKLALAAAVLAEDEDGGLQTLLDFIKAGRSEELVTVTDYVRDDGRKKEVQKLTAVDSVADWMCWTIGGVSSFSCTFFNALDAEAPIASFPIDPIPRALAPIICNYEYNTLELTLSDFFFADNSSPDAAADPLNVYLGPLGPLRYTLWKSAAVPSRSEFGARPVPAVPYESTTSPQQYEHLPKVMSSFPSDENHIIVVVKMPFPERIIKTMQNCAAQATLNRMINASAAVEQGAGKEAGGSADFLESDQAWLGEAGPGPSSSLTAHARHDEEDMGLTLNMAHNDFASFEQHFSSSFGEAPPDEQQPDQTDLHMEDHTDTDPSLRDPSYHTPGPIDAGTTEAALSFMARDTEQQAEADDMTYTSALRLHTPLPKAGRHTRMVPLPLLLIRSDGVGFGTGASVVAQKLDDGQGRVGGGANTKWGLRLIES